MLAAVRQQSVSQLGAHFLVVPGKPGIFSDLCEGATEKETRG